MSESSVRVWDGAVYGVPADFREVNRMAQRLASQFCQPTEAVREFYRQLQAYALEQEDREWVDRYGQIFDANEANSWRRHVAAREIILPNVGWEVVLKFMVEAANRLGLVVFCEDMVMTFVAPDVVLPPERQVVWQELLGALEPVGDFAPKSLKQFRAYMEPKIDEMMVRHGFIKCDSKCIEKGDISYKKNFLLVK